MSTLKKGELTVKTKEGAVETYGSLTGMLTGIGISKQEFQGQQYDRLELSISDGLEIYELQMRFDSGYSRGFCYTIKNADLEKPIKFAPMYKERMVKKNRGYSFLNLANHYPATTGRMRPMDCLL